MPHLTHAHSAAAKMPETLTVDGRTGGDQPQRQKQPRSRFRPDGTRRRAAGEIEKRRPYVEFWKAYQARQAQQQQREQDTSSAEPASSSTTRRHSGGPQHFRIYTEEDQGEPTDGPWQETSAAQDNWQSYGWHEYEDDKSWDWRWRDRDSRATWTEARQDGTDRPASTQTRQASPENRDGEIRQPPTPPSKRSRSTQVTDGLEANQPVESATLPHTPQLRRLHDIVGFLESLAKQGLPTMLEAFQCSDYTRPRCTTTSTTMRPQ